jgi:uncharacterized membrane protein YkgB
MCHAAKHHHHHVEREQAERPATRDEAHQEFVQKASKFGGAFLLCVAIWLLTGTPGLWPLWVLLIGGLILARDAREIYSSDSIDDDEDDRTYSAV